MSGSGFSAFFSLEVFPWPLLRRGMHAQAHLRRRPRHRPALCVVPDTSDTVNATASTLSDPGAFPRSFLARELFAGSNIEIDNDVVAFSIDGEVHIESHVTDGNGRAAVFLSPYGGGAPEQQQIENTGDAGAFSVRFAPGSSGASTT